MTTPIQELESFLKEEGWPLQGIVPSPFSDEVGIMTSFQGENGLFSCFAIAFASDHRIAFYAKCPYITPAEKMQEMAEFLHRVNYDLVIGNFELNYDTGEVRFKASLDFEGATLNKELMAGTIYPSVLTMNLYLPLIEQVNSSELSPSHILGEAR
jgi:hypothetical protein